MTRQKAILTLLSTIVGVVSNKISFASDSEVISSGFKIVTTNPQSVTFNLDSFKDFTFTQGKNSITLTPAEIMDAIK